MQIQHGLYCTGFAPEGIVRGKDLNVVAFDARKENRNLARSGNPRTLAMCAGDFDAWLSHVGFSERRAAKVLQINRATVAKYRREGAPAHIGYACAAIALGMPVWARAE